MKKLLTKLFVGDYKFRALGFFHSLPRASTIIMPIMILCGILVSTGTFPLYSTMFGCFALSILTIAIYLGFFHFWIWPAKWKNQDDSQKWQQGNGIRLGVLKDVLTDEEWNEWEEINDIMRKKFVKE